MAWFVFDGIAFVTLTLILSTLSGSSADVRIPSVFRENPNARLSKLRRTADNPNYRLPNNTLPLHYDIHVKTDVHTGSRDFSGEVTIRLEVVEDTRSIVLHSRLLDISKVSIIKENGAKPYELKFDYNSDLEFLSLSSNNEYLRFIKGEQWSLNIVYNGSLRDDNGGFFISNYKDKNNQTHYFATTHFESTDARHGFPCYDEPNKRATFAISIAHDPSYHAISNMPVDMEKSTPNKTVFKTSVKMSTYLVAFIISDFQYIEGKLNSLGLRIYSRAGAQPYEEWALMSSLLVVQRLREYFDINVVLPKIDQVAIPDFLPGAMENWGLIIYREDFLTYDKSRSTVNTQTNIAILIAHEYAHQWFGNLVAIEWWTYLWLKEGFATLFAYKATGDVYPEWGIHSIFLINEYQHALDSDADLSSRPMTRYVQKPSEIVEQYELSASYSKAASVLSMWQHALSEEVFREALCHYITQNQFSTAKENDLFDALQRAAKEEDYALPVSIESLLSSWTRQGGYPVLTVTRNYENGSFTVVQEAFFNNASHYVQNTWYIPFNFASRSKADFHDTKATHFMMQNKKELLVNDSQIPKGDWLILNKQSTGYYRINYDKKNWGLITESLIEKPYKIHPYNRAQLMHDAYRFSTSGRLNHSVLLDLLTYLPNEDQYAPWWTANTILTTLNRYLSSDAEYKNFTNYVQELVGDTYERLHVYEQRGEQHLQKYVRPIVISLACMAGMPSCLADTYTKLLDYIEDGIKIELNLEAEIYCNGLKLADDTEFDFVFNELLNSNDKVKRGLLISALGCAPQRDRIDKLLASSIDMNNGLETHERTSILNAVYSRGDVGFFACIDFLKKHWGQYAKLGASIPYAENPLNADIHSMSSYVVNKELEKAFLELVVLFDSSNRASFSLEDSDKRNIEANCEWLKYNRDPIVNWLTKHSANSAGVIISTSAIVLALSMLLVRLL